MPDVLTLNQLADHLQLSERTIYRLLGRGELPGILLPLGSRRETIRRLIESVTFPEPVDTHLIREHVLEREELASTATEDGVAFLARTTRLRRYPGFLSALRIAIFAASVVALVRSAERLLVYQPALTAP
jgi:predicted DNA-binding transcriptional regulator AlpA